MAGQRDTALVPVGSTSRSPGPARRRTYHQNQTDAGVEPAPTAEGRSTALLPIPLVSPSGRAHHQNQTDAGVEPAPTAEGRSIALLPIPLVGLSGRPCPPPGASSTATEGSRPPMLNYDAAIMVTRPLAGPHLPSLSLAYLAGMEGNSGITRRWSGAKPKGGKQWHN